MSNSPRVHSSRKTHPIVLVAATALTIFSLLGSAAITGLIPTVPYPKQGLLQDMDDSKPNSQAKNGDQKAPADNTGAKITSTNNNQRLKGIDETKISDTKVKQARSDKKLSADCGLIISIKSVKQVRSNIAENLMGGEKDKVNSRTAYLIKVQMENGGYRLFTQYSKPQHVIGDIVKLNNNELVDA